jgi:hypothetical protein
MNKFGIALTGIGMGIAGTTAAGTFEAPLNTLSVPVLEAEEISAPTPLFTDQTEGEVYITASGVSGSVGGGGFAA